MNGNYNCGELASDLPPPHDDPEPVRHQALAYLRRRAKDHDDLVVLASHLGLADLLNPREELSA